MPGLRKLTRNDVEIRFVAVPEDMDPREQIDDGILAAHPDILATWRCGEVSPSWFCAEVTVAYGDSLVSDPVYLGGCSYESWDDFVTHSDYYDSMVDEAMADLDGKLAQLWAQLEGLVTP